MQYHVVSYGELPQKLRINGLPCRCKPGERYGLREAAEFRRDVWDYNYRCFGTRPMAEDLEKYGPWLTKTKPFFVEVEKHVYTRWCDLQKGKVVSEDKVLPKKIVVDYNNLTKIFDRFYFSNNLSNKSIRFVFDYMAPTYEANIDYGLNLRVNIKLIESIVNFDFPSGHSQSDQMKILDYGVGTGICTYAKPDVKNYKSDNWKIVGLDISKKMIDEARKKIQLNKEDPSYLLSEAHQIIGRKSHLPDKSFDAAMACFAVQYFLGLSPYAEIYRLLQDGAPFVCNVLKNKMNQTEELAKKAGLILQGDRQQLKLGRDVSDQPVMLLVFKKSSEHGKRIISP